MKNNQTRKIYDDNASSWERHQPNSLSDFTGRPKIFELCGDVSGLNILDIGCGEGYCSRTLMTQGAEHIEGIDISPMMIKIAGDREEKDKLGINYQTGDVQDLPYSDSTFDLVIGVFVYNYLHIKETMKSMKEVYRVLKNGGRFIFAVPHPAFPQIKKEKKSPFFFDFGNSGYFTSRDTRYHGKIFCRDGKELPVQMVHKLLSDYIKCLQESGFNSLPEMHELGVCKEHLVLDELFFKPVYDIPLHLAIAINK